MPHDNVNMLLPERVHVSRIADYDRPIEAPSLFQSPYRFLPATHLTTMLSVQHMSGSKSWLKKIIAMAQTHNFFNEDKNNFEFRDTQLCPGSKQSSFFSHDVLAICLYEDGNEYGIEERSCVLYSMALRADETSSLRKHLITFSSSNIFAQSRLQTKMNHYLNTNITQSDNLRTCCVFVLFALPS